MTKIQVQPDNLVLEIAEYETILTASLRNDILIFTHVVALEDAQRVGYRDRGHRKPSATRKIELELAEKLDLPAEFD